MALVVCIACVKSKRRVRSRAEDLYISPLFCKALAYARSLAPDRLFILSAEHGLLMPHEEIAPYERTLNVMSAAARRAWAGRVLARLGNLADLERDRFVFLAGERYREGLTPHIRRWEAPLKGLAFGEQLEWLTRHGPTSGSAKAL